VSGVTAFSFRKPEISTQLFQPKGIRKAAFFRGTEDEAPGVTGIEVATTPIQASNRRLPLRVNGLTEDGPMVILRRVPRPVMPLRG